MAETWILSAKYKKSANLKIAKEGKKDVREMGHGDFAFALIRWYQWRSAQYKAVVGKELVLP